MKTFKQYLQYVTEELNTRQKKTVDRWVKDYPDAHAEGHPNAVAISKSVIPEGSHKITIPFNDDDGTVDAHPDVESHLRNHGYSISNYKKGTVKDRYNREVSIGKILEKTKADKKVKHAFLTDPNRIGARQSKKRLMITITRHPYHVAGMSTGQGWTSCMDMSCGFEKRYLKDDVQQGTHVAYLHHEDDPDMKNPIARVALRPFHSEDKKETILRPEQHTYGNAPSSFHKTVNAWSEKNFPANKEKLYIRNKKVYSEDGEDVIGDTNFRLNHPDARIRREFFYDKNKNVTPEQIHKALDDKDPSVRNFAIRHPNRSRENLEKALNNTDYMTRYAAEWSLKHETNNKR